MIRSGTFWLVLSLVVSGCSGSKYLGNQHMTHRLGGAGGRSLAVLLDTLSPESREARITQEIFKGNVPAFLQKMVRIHTQVTDSHGKAIKAYYYVTPDYLSIGNDQDFFRVPLTPRTANNIARHFHCFLPTCKIVDDIYKQAGVKLEPQPLTEERERVSTFYLHQQLIEKQRKARKGLIAGIKKDVVITSKKTTNSRLNSIAIYGWHKMDGTPIQPLYMGHAEWYVDYSHGIRLVMDTLVVDGRTMYYKDVLKNATLKGLLCNEDGYDFYEYK